MVGLSVMARTDLPRPGNRFLMPVGGDGDPVFFGKPRVLVLTKASWFPDSISDYGEALLFHVEGGEHSEEFVALTSRSLARLPEQIADFGWASVIVHRIKNPTASFDGGRLDSLAIGMSFIERMERSD